jgi:hypothetical protein
MCSSFQLGRKKKCDEQKEGQLDDNCLQTLEKPITNNASKLANS